MLAGDWDAVELNAETAQPHRAQDRLHDECGRRLDLEVGPEHVLAESTRAYSCGRLSAR